VVSKYEIKLLKDLNGERQEGLQWGAAMGAALEFLKEEGYVTRGAITKITEKGKKFLNGI
jgi:hypothetical protein